MTVLEINGKRVEVDAGFKSLSPAEQQRIVEDIAASMGQPQGRGGVVPNQSNLGQVNRGVADALDAITLRGPGNALVRGINNVTGLDLQERPAAEDAFRSANIATAEGEAESIGQSAFRGAGEAAASAPVIVGGLLQLARAGSGAVSAAADDALKALATIPGFSAEITAGATSRGASRAVEEQGGGEVAQAIAGVGAPLGLAGATMAAGQAIRGAGRVAAATPGINLGVRAARGVAKAVLPMTETGAREVAREELVRRAGSEARLAELEGRISETDPLARTPAQQTGDPNFLALEDAAKAEDPLLRVELDRRADVSREAASEGLSEGAGSVADAQSFFRGRVTQFRSDLEGRIERELQMASEGVEAVGPRQSESGASAGAVERLQDALANTKAEEAALWAKVPQDAVVGTQATAARAVELIDSTAWAQRRDIPDDVRAAFGPGGPIGEETTVQELYGLYSQMRQVAREARASSAPNDNRARIATRIADAILEDLGAVDGSTPVGQVINEARAFSRAMHETFDQGAVGRMLEVRRTGGAAIEPEAALGTTVGRSGSRGAVADEQILDAAPGAAEDVADFLRGRFVDRALDAQGKFTPAAARRFMRENRETLARYPELRNEFNRALSSKDAADSFAVRTRARLETLENSSPVTDFAGRPAETAVDAILKASDPIEAAKAVARTARKDPSGAGLAGVKGAFSDRLIERATNSDGVLSGKGLQSLLRDNRMNAAMRQVYSDGEMRRMKTIADALASIDAPRGQAGPVIDAPANAILSRVVQVAAAQQGGRLGAGAGIGGSLQTANIFTRTADRMLNNLTNTRAREMLREAVEDPGLMKALMAAPKNDKMPRWAANRLAPYLAGAATSGEE